MANDTIYLCNFRVSVDGEWLCLRELSDVSVAQQGSNSSTEGAEESGQETDDDSVLRNPVLVERANLLNIAKLCIKALIESALEEGRILDDEHIPLQQFFVVMEHILAHGLKGKKFVLEKKKEFWSALEVVEKIMPEAKDITDSVRNLPGLKTNIGRSRAWLRLALMQKKLADYFRALIERKDILSEFYEPGAALMEEEAAVIAGLLVGLNVIDCNLYLKGDDLDSAPSVLDMSVFMKDGNYLDKPEETGACSATDGGSPAQTSDISSILDQKNYLEELNRHLNAQISSLQIRVKGLEENNSHMKQELAVANNNLLSIQAMNEKYQNENARLSQDVSKKIELVRADMDVEREAYNTSRAGLDSLYKSAQEDLQRQTQERNELERDLELQKSMKTEMEMAMKLLEKDIHEKQDTIVTLRKQLEDIKAINLDLFTKLQSFESTAKHKSDIVVKLEEKTNQMAATIKALEERLKICDNDKQAAMETARKLGQTLAEKDLKRSALETDLKIEREWRNQLQKDLSIEKDLVAQLQKDVGELVSLREQYVKVSDEHSHLQETCEAQELALAEMGSKLSESQLKMDDMKEAVTALDKRVWTSDKDSLTCMSCEKPFSVARRKHHCRNCGGIYCNSCSDNCMPLPSSAKPVRVCDRCHTNLLQRYSASST
ncbi:RUN and FYVE domain-containing protein 2-like isoform X2 [Anneissia japonica]|uniref:RUN and FYVE domain-containing protein 2-like isoform X2 n=1 Tax=Anneissia japonica TaxID=1529436 RepID=UPI001425859C|nr:RUN and FYVE domain-containing protein 2-like isoform X2 [Anneissia japonica]